MSVAGLHNTTRKIKPSYETTMNKSLSVRTSFVCAFSVQKVFKDLFDLKLSPVKGISDRQMGQISWN